MNLEYKIIENDNFDKIGLKKFILNINNDFPIPITDKVDIDEFLDKIQKNGVVCCVYDGKEVVSGAFFYANDFVEKVGFLTLFATLSNYRRYGLGSNLIDMMVDYCVKLGFKKIQLYTHVSNDNAINFYLKKGFYFIDCDRKNDVKLEKNIVLN